MEIKFCYIVATGNCTMHEATEPTITEFYQKKWGKISLTLTLKIFENPNKVFIHVL